MIDLADQEQNVIAHLEELRKRLIITVIAFILFFIVGFIYVEDIYQWLVKDFDEKLMVLGPSDILWIYFMLATVVSVAATIPVFAFQLWLFVKPAFAAEGNKNNTILYSSTFSFICWWPSFWILHYFPNGTGFLTWIKQWNVCDQFYSR